MSRQRPDLRAPAPTPAQAQELSFWQKVQVYLPWCCGGLEQTIDSIGERGGPLAATASVVLDAALNVGEEVGERIAGHAIAAARPTREDPHTDIVHAADRAENGLHIVVGAAQTVADIAARTALPGTSGVVVAAAVNTAAVLLDRGGEDVIATGQAALEIADEELVNRGVVGTVEDVTIAGLHGAEAVVELVERELGANPHSDTPAALLGQATSTGVNMVVAAGLLGLLKSLGPTSFDHDYL